jgi:hypothetical protein
MCPVANNVNDEAILDETSPQQPAIRGSSSTTSTCTTQN